MYNDDCGCVDGYVGLNKEMWMSSVFGAWSFETSALGLPGLGFRVGESGFSLGIRI